MTEAKNLYAVRTDGPQTTHSKLLGKEAMTIEGEVSLGEQIATALADKGARVKDLFLEWDEE